MVWASVNPCTFSISFSDLVAREKKVCIFSGKIPIENTLSFSTREYFASLSHLGYTMIFIKN